jgi:hypothetical protein
MYREAPEGPQPGRIAEDRRNRASVPGRRPPKPRCRARRRFLASGLPHLPAEPGLRPAAPASSGCRRLKPTRPAVSRAPHPSSAKERLRRSTEGSDLGRGFLRLREDSPEPASRPPRSGVRVTPGRRRRPRPTSRRLMSAPSGGRDTRKEAQTREQCQGLFSKNFSRMEGKGNPHHERTAARSAPAPPQAAGARISQFKSARSL